MGLLGWIAAIGAARYVQKAIGKSNEEIRKREAEKSRRKNTPCSFSDGLSFDEFEKIVHNATKGIKRITSVDVDGPIVYCDVRTQSGISEWSFSIDYNDYGHITGSYWLSTENHDSTIPKSVAERIEKALDAAFEKQKKNAESISSAAKQQVPTSQTGETEQNNQFQEILQLSPSFRVQWTGVDMYYLIDCRGSTEVVVSNGDRYFGAILSCLKNGSTMLTIKLHLIGKCNMPIYLVDPTVRRVLDQLWRVGALTSYRR